MSAEQTPDIEAVLAEHEWTWKAATPQRVDLVCSCGDELIPVTSSAVATLADHRAHVAQALAPVLAAAVREAKVEALREAAQDLDDLVFHGYDLPASTAWWLRDRADRVAVDAPEGGEGR